MGLSFAMAATRLSSLLVALLNAASVNSTPTSSKEEMALCDQDWVNFEDAETGWWFMDLVKAGDRKGYPYGLLGPPGDRGKFQIRLEPQESPYIHGGGDYRMRFYANTTFVPGYRYLYSSVAGGIYFMRSDTSNAKQWWVIHSEAYPSDPIVRHKSLVAFENLNWPNTWMQRHKGNMVYDLDGRHLWRIRLADRPADSPCKAALRTTTTTTSTTTTAAVRHIRTKK